MKQPRINPLNKANFGHNPDNEVTMEIANPKPFENLQCQNRDWMSVSSVRICNSMPSAFASFHVIPPEQNAPIIIRPRYHPATCQGNRKLGYPHSCALRQYDEETKFPKGFQPKSHGMIETACNN